MKILRDARDRNLTQINFKQKRVFICLYMNNLGKLERDSMSLSAIGLSLLDLCVRVCECMCVGFILKQAVLLW